MWAWYKFFTECVCIQLDLFILSFLTKYAISSSYIMRPCYLTCIFWTNIVIFFSQNFFNIIRKFVYVHLQFHYLTTLPSEYVRLVQKTKFNIECFFIKKFFFFQNLRVKYQARIMYEDGIIYKRLQNHFFFV